LRTHDLRLLFRLSTLLWLLAGCATTPQQTAVPVVYLSGDQAENLRAEFAREKVEFRRLAFGVPKPLMPVYVRGSKNNDGALLTKLRAYFGGQIAVYKGRWRNHRYIEHSALYLPVKSTQPVQLFGGVCGEDYSLDLRLQGEDTTVQVDRWVDDPPSYQQLYSAQGVMARQNGQACFTANDQAVPDKTPSQPLRLCFEYLAIENSPSPWLRIVESSDPDFLGCTLATTIPRNPPKNARPLR